MTEQDSTPRRPEWLAPALASVVAVAAVVGLVVALASRDGDTVATTGDTVATTGDTVAATGDTVETTDDTGETAGGTVESTTTVPFDPATTVLVDGVAYVPTYTCRSFPVQNADLGLSDGHLTDELYHLVSADGRRALLQLRVLEGMVTFAELGGRSGTGELAGAEDVRTVAIDVGGGEVVEVTVGPLTVGPVCSSIEYRTAGDPEAVLARADLEFASPGLVDVCDLGERRFLHTFQDDTHLVVEERGGDAFRATLAIGTDPPAVGDGTSGFGATGTELTGTVTDTAGRTLEFRLSPDPAVPFHACTDAQAAAAAVWLD